MNTKPDDILNTSKSRELNQPIDNAELVERIIEIIGSPYYDAGYDRQQTIRHAEKIIAALTQAPQGVGGDDIAHIRLGRIRLKNDFGAYTGWTQDVRSDGKNILVDVYYTYPEGPGYKSPERHKFLLEGVEALTQQPQPYDTAEVERVAAAIFETHQDKRNDGDYDYDGMAKAAISALKDTQAMQAEHRGDGL